MTHTMKQHDFIELDGSFGEGGGQILRTALSLSMVTGRPFRIENIRANRSKPGLMRQHMTAVKAAAEISAADMTGASVGSTVVEFIPREITPGDYTFSIGTAGSTTLVLQTVLPALMTASAPSTVSLEGGTHNIHAPSITFLQRAFLPLLQRTGPKIDVTLERHGFYPSGGGRVAASITPCKELAAFDLLERGDITHQRAVATVVGLSGEIAKRELGVVRGMLGWSEDRLEIEQIKRPTSVGNVMSIEIGSEHVTEIFTGFGQRGVSAEQVATRAAEAARAYLAHGMPVGTHLADQLMLPLAIAGGGSYRTGPLSLLAQTNAAVIEQFLGVRVGIDAAERVTTVRITR